MHGYLNFIHHQMGKLNSSLLEKGDVFVRFLLDRLSLSCHRYPNNWRPVEDEQALDPRMVGHKFSALFPGCFCG